MPRARRGRDTNHNGDAAAQGRGSAAAGPASAEAGASQPLAALGTPGLPVARRSRKDRPENIRADAPPATPAPPAAPAAPAGPRAGRKAKDPQLRMPSAEVREPIPDETRRPGPVVAPALAGVIPAAYVARLSRFTPPLLRALRPQTATIVTVIAAALAALVAWDRGLVALSNQVLEGLGFDGGRAWLISALIFGGTAAAVGYLFGGVRWAASLAGCAVCVALFGPTFTQETRDAMAATGALGAFDPVGWIETFVSLLAVGLGVGWASATCAVPVRAQLRLVVVDSRDAIRLRTRDPRIWARPVAALLALCLLAVTLPVAGSMFDRGADVRMIAGGPPRQGLMPDDAGPGNGGLPSGLPTDQPSDAPSGASSAVPSDTPQPIASASASATAVPSATQNLEPWKASAPTGAGRMTYLAMPIAGTATPTPAAQIGVYLPPGYDAGTSSYPVVYEEPSPFSLWNSGIHIRSMLDQLISTGVLPPTIYVFIDGSPGPYPDSQCVNSFDGKQQVDTLVSVTVPTYIDKSFRTIKRPAARATMGMSQGGYCAAMLAARHPDVFGEAVSFSGYYTAGAADASSNTVFGGDGNLRWRYSPIAQAPLLKPAVRSTLYFVVVAQMKQAFYGRQAASFTDALRVAGIGYDLIDAADPHGWPQVRVEFQQALLLVARRQAALGVFG